MRITYFKMGGLFGSRVGNEDELQIHIFLPDIYPKEEEVQLVSREDMSFGINFCKIKKMTRMFTTLNKSSNPI